MAKWKPFDLTWGRSIYYCTECKEGIEVPTSCGKPMYKFCPMCGARMDTTDTPQTERIKTHDYCDICNHKGCGTCIANNLDDYCVPSNYEPTTQTETQNSNLTFEKADTPQTDCGWGKPTTVSHREDKED